MSSAATDSTDAARITAILESLASFLSAPAATPSRISEITGVIAVLDAALRALDLGPASHNAGPIVEDMQSTVASARQLLTHVNQGLPVLTRAVSDLFNERGALTRHAPANPRFAQDMEEAVALIGRTASMALFDPMVETLAARADNLLASYYTPEIQGVRARLEAIIGLQPLIADAWEQLRDTSRVLTMTGIQLHAALDSEESEHDPA